MLIRLEKYGISLQKERLSNSMTICLTVCLSCPIELCSISRIVMCAMQKLLFATYFLWYLTWPSLSLVASIVFSLERLLNFETTSLTIVDLPCTFDLWSSSALQWHVSRRTSTCAPNIQIKKKKKMSKSIKK